MKRNFRIVELHELIRWMFISFVSNYIEMLNYINDEERKVNSCSVDCQALFDNSLFISLILGIGKEDAIKTIKSECNFLRNDYDVKSCTGFGNPITEKEYKSFIDSLENLFIEVFIDDVFSAYSSSEIKADEYINDFSYKGSPVALISTDELAIDVEVKEKLNSSDLDELSIKDMKDLVKSAYNIVKAVDNECISVDINDETDE